MLSENMIKVHKTIIVPVVLYCQIEGVPEENVWTSRDEVTGGWRKLYYYLHNLCSSSNITTMLKSRRMRWAWNVAHMRIEKCV
jgi:hypothetical protein